MSSSEPTIARSARWPWLVFTVFPMAAAVGIVLVGSNGGSYAEQVAYILAFALFGFVGAVILSRDPRNVIGGLLLWISGITAISFVAGELLTWTLTNGATGWWLVVLAHLSALGWLLGIMPTIFLLPLLFPDGRLPSPRWKPYLWFVLAFLGLLAIWILFGSEELSGSSDTATIANPLFVPALRLRQMDALIAVLYPTLFGVAVASLILRFRRAGAEERQQIKWVVFGVVAALAGTLASMVLGSRPLLSSAVGGLALLAFPLTIGISVMRYRLYDLDVVVKKALVAGLLAAFALLVYGVLVALAGQLTTEVSSGAVFLVALVLGAAFRPAMRLARKVADRLVYGRRATPYEVLTEFSGRVGEAYATDDVLDRMAEILAGGVGAERAKVWLRVGGELRIESTWPDDDDTYDTIPVPAGALPAIAGEDAVEVRDRDELLGVLSVAMPADDPMNPAKEKLVRDLASQAGLAMRNVRLVEDLKASRRRLVSAQDEERRRLERNIHDGAQQQLVALAVKARLARQLTGSEPDKAGHMLEQIESETQTALEDLRDLARGIYPPLLADKGLAAALQAQARKAPLPVSVEPDQVGRYPQDLEATVYFCCLEALNNVAKYAEASGATISLVQTNGSLTFTVTDDGRGFDPSAIGYGTGLRGMADRLEAIGGELSVTSAPGSGTTVSGRVRDVSGR